MVDVFQIHLHLKNFMGTLKPYFSLASFNKMIALWVFFFLGIVIIYFRASKLKLRHFNAKLVGMQLTRLPTVILDFRGLNSINW